jgi:uncharacterized protein GlcG (DUF336 family)
MNLYGNQMLDTDQIHPDTPVPLYGTELTVNQEFILSILSLDQANHIILEAIRTAREAKYKPMGIAVLDAAGNLVAFSREDGASMFRFDIARGKAWGAVGMGCSSRALAERAKDNPNFFVSLAATAEGKFLAQPGAVLIKDAQGNILGAAGASGGTGDEDELICAAGVRAAGLLSG